ncbi:MAG TPA: class I tRNA ligase family protein, partial [Candidatus Absconditabacterales bacterium]|nr:class I tRNA ligase family protein [Candidatus Absconditabacterales bacterium]
LGEKIVIDRYGKMQNSGVPEIEGLKISDARTKIMELFESKGDIVVKRDPITQSKQISERGKVPVEIIPIKQWFVNLLDKKQLLLEQNDRMQWHPEFMKKRSNDWIENLQRDWNISRSRKYGIPIPVRYNITNDEIIFPSREQLARGPIDPTSELPDGYTAEQVRGETLVLDTWFTSGLTPQINQKFLERDGYTQKILPMSLRPQAHDIIRTWLLYTTLQSHFASGEIAFHDVMMSGFCLAEKGEKFSKSKGNAKFDPEQVIAQRGADAVRYRASGGQLGKDIMFDENEFKIGQKLVTKLWNAANFVFMNLSDFDPQTVLEEKDLYPIDLWILNQINATSKAMTEYLNDYEYGQAKLEFEKFFRHDFCDNYLEIVKEKIYKPEKYADGNKQKLSAQFALYHTFFAIIKLIAPYLPFITEELYQTYYKNNIGSDSIHVLSFPNNDIFSITQDMISITTAVEQLLTIIEKVRGYKTEKQLGLGTELTHLKITSKTDLSVFMDDIMSGTRAGKVSFQTGDETNITVE